MKKIFLTCLLTWATGLSFAQISIDSLTSRSDSLHQQVTSDLAYYFDDLDDSYISSGLLFEKGIPYFNLSSYTGSPSDSMNTSNMGFGLAYASVASMALDSTFALPDPDSYMSAMKVQDFETDTVRLFGLHQEFHHLDSNSLDSNWISYSSGQFHDVLPRSGSPYIKDEVFMIAPAVHQVNHLSFTVLLEDQFHYNNTGLDVDSVFVDLGDGRGYKATTLDSPISVNYGADSIKSVKVKLLYENDSTYESQFEWYIKDENTRNGDQDVDFTHTIDPIPASGDPWTGRCGGEINVFLACGHTDIVKPFIWAEAFNPIVGDLNMAALTPVDIFDRMTHEDAMFNSEDLWDYLINEGYDIIILDYDNGADYLPRTAEFIEEALRWVNERKHANGSYEENVLLGQSMGGVCSNYALKEMELDNEDHEVGTFIIFDSPIMGVNIPIAAQECLLDICTLPVNHPDPNFAPGYLPLYYYVPILEDAANLLFLPATRTMTRYWFNPFPSQQIHQDLHRWDEFYTEMHQTMNGGPKECEVLTITNGSRKGLNGTHNFSAGDKVVKSLNTTFTLYSGFTTFLLHEQFSQDADPLFVDAGQVWAKATLLTWIADPTIIVDINLWATPDASSGNLYFSNILLDSWIANITNFGQPIAINLTHVTKEDDYQNYDFKGIDAAPGGFFGNDNEGIILDNLSVNIPAQLEPSVFKMQTYCFTPTFSVLNYHSNSSNNEFLEPFKNFENNSTEIMNNNTRNVDNYLSNSEQNNWNSPNTYENTAHTWFTPQSTEYMLYHLVGEDALSGTTSLVSHNFNFGRSELTPSTDAESGDARMTQRVIYDDLLVDNSQILGINRNFQIGFSNDASNPPYNSPPAPESSFSVSIGDACVYDPIEVDITNSAQFILGDGVNRSGHCVVHSNNKVIVRDGGELIIKEGSSFLLADGSELEIQDGGTVIVEDSAVLHAGFFSKIDYHVGAELQLNGDNAKLVLEGDLELEDGCDFRPLHVGVPSGKIIVKNQSGLILGGNNAQVRIIGDGVNDEMIIFEDFGYIEAPINMEKLQISNCQIGFGSFHSYSLLSACELLINSVSVNVHADLISYDIHPQIVGTNDMRISSSDFTDVKLRCVDYGNPTSPFLHVTNTDFDVTFEPSETMVEIDGGHYLIQGSNFQNFKGEAVKSVNCDMYSRIESTDFTGASSSNGFAVFDYSDCEVRITGCNFAKSSFGAYKYDGRLGVRCSDFDNIGSAAIMAGINCWLEMSTGAGEGYNTFTNMLQYNIGMIQAKMLSIHNGYNYFDDNSYPYVYGSVQIPNFTQAKQYLNAKKNQWNSSNTVPSDSDIDVTSSITSNDIPLVMSDPTSASCGTYDPENPKPEILADFVDSPKIKTPTYTDSIEVHDAIHNAVSYSEVYDSTADDSEAIKRLSEILLYDYSDSDLQDTITHMWLDLANEELKRAVQHMFSTGKLKAVRNQSSFETEVAQYVDVMNDRGFGGTVPDENYHEEFNLEMEKAHLFRLIDRLDEAQSIVYNTEDCDLDSSEQVALNHWKFMMEEEEARITAGLEYEVDDSTYTDTTEYETPVSYTPEEYEFGSEIYSPTSIDLFSSCGKSPFIQPDDGGESWFRVFPNPSDGNFTVDYNINTEKPVYLKIFNLEGKEILTVQVPSGHQYQVMDLSMVDPGMYFCTLITDAEVLSQTKVMIY